MNSLLVDVVFICFIIVLFFTWYNIIKIKMKLEKTEKKLRSEKIVPEGTDISHGMVLTKDNRLIGDEKPTLSWIKKLSG